MPETDVLQILQARYARGEITEEKYFEMVSAIKRMREQPEIRSESASASRSGFTYPSNITVPTDSSPLVIRDGLELRSDGFMVKGQPIPYDDVIGLWFVSSLFNGSGDTALSVRFKNYPELSFSSMTLMFISGPRRRKVVAAYLFLAYRTRQTRLQARIDEFRQNDYIQVDENIRVYANGDVTKRSLRINAKDSQRNGYFIIGVTRGFGKSVNPDEVIVGLDGIGVLSTKIIFELKWDKDIVGQLLRQIANSPKK
jgi:hypothetical protein